MNVATLLITVPAILALVNLAKEFGVRGKWSTGLAVVLGSCAQLAEYGFMDAAHSPAGWYQAGVTGLILGLSAAGLYDVAATVGAGVAPPRRAVVEEELAGDDLGHSDA